MGITKIVLVAVVVGMLSSIGVASAVGASNPSIFEILSFGGDITFIGAGSTTKMIVVGPPSFVPADPGISSVIIDSSKIRFPSAEHVLAPIDLPDGSTITAFECVVEDSSSSALLCELVEDAHGAASASVITELTSNSQDFVVQTLSTSGLNHLVDRDANNYQVNINTGACPTCIFYSIKVTYTIPSGMVVGGEFYPVDRVSLVLAYGLVNSWWMAPVGLGIGVGVYLIKRKID